MVEIDGLKLLDGGIADSIPVAYFERIGYTKNVIILTQPQGYQKEKNQLLPLIRVKYRHYPNLVKALETRHLMYNAELELIAEQENRGNLFVIRPIRPCRSNGWKRPREAENLLRDGGDEQQKQRGSGSLRF